MTLSLSMPEFHCTYICSTSSNEMWALTVSTNLLSANAALIGYARLLFTHIDFDISHMYSHIRDCVALCTKHIAHAMYIYI